MTPEHICPKCGSEGSKVCIVPRNGEPLVLWRCVACNKGWTTKNEVHVEEE